MASEFEKTFNAKESVLMSKHTLAYRDWFKRREGALWALKWVIKDNVSDLAIQQEIESLENL